MCFAVHRYTTWVSRLGGATGIDLVIRMMSPALVNALVSLLSTTTTYVRYLRGIGSNVAACRKQMDALVDPELYRGGAGEKYLEAEYSGVCPIVPRECLSIRMTRLSRYCSGELPFYRIW